MKKLEESIEEQGGLESYQVASITGQSASRGGDSSKLLVSWLKSWKPLVQTQGPTHDPERRANPNSSPRLLEVGALSTTNACSTCGVFNVTRIDLHSQAPGILTQDFMERPLPRTDGERFDVISLSLVLNYVPDAHGRGNMLERTCDFLMKPADRTVSGGDDASTGSETSFFPALFLVLPAPCVTNSRYLDQERLVKIMENLGYNLMQSKVSSKLAYSLWRWTGPVSKPRPIPKVEVNAGKTRNNFAIIIT